MQNFIAIILAAGEGTRMKSKKPKVLHKILGKAMIEHVVQSLKEAGANKIVVVTGFKEQEVRQGLGNSSDIIFAHQQKQLGTGHAVQCAMDNVAPTDTVVVLCGDTPLVTADSLKNLVEHHTSQGNGQTVISATAKNPAGYGRIVQQNGNISKIVEQKDATEEELKITEVNTGIYCYTGKSLISAISKIENNNKAGEYYLTDTVEILLRDNEKVGSVSGGDYNEFAGVNDRIQLHDASNFMRERINRNHMINGVTIIDSATTYIGRDVRIGADTVIYPNNILEGSTSIGEDCTLLQNNRIKDSIIGDKNKIESSVLLESTVGNSSSIGPFAYVRPNSQIGDEVKVGDFVEIKNTVMGDGSKASHLTYLGDADIGKDVNIGCGVITVNYDGQKKNRTKIEDRVFVGCNSNLIAPVVIEENSYVAAGTTVTKKVDTYSLAISRVNQENKKDWVKKRNSVEN